MSATSTPLPRPKSFRVDKKRRASNSRSAQVLPHQVYNDQVMALAVVGARNSSGLTEMWVAFSAAPTTLTGGELISPSQ